MQISLLFEQNYSFYATLNRHGATLNNWGMKLKVMRTQAKRIKTDVASSNFRGLSKFSTWLFRIAYNCYLDYRKKATIETVSVDSKQVLDMPSGDDPDRSFRYQHLYQALEQLQEKEKVVIVLYYFEDLSIKEIASILQMPVGTVKYHRSNGRNHLRNFLQ